ncbi:hypothetical protein PAHAL_1G039200 [Panicum hallii]|uniref:Uncharacterized protein n=1 Tax=Panicum hallii TaxID=206008 RepID=A0A2T8KTV5_9POAL|nr:hypothetical protein PAHAL_1G039200 [Panicum hallii]
MKQLPGVVADQSARICDRSIEFGRLRFGVGRRSNSCKDNPRGRVPPSPFLGSSSSAVAPGGGAEAMAVAAGGIASHPLCAVPVPCASLARSGGSSRPLTYAAASRGGGWESQRQLGTRDFELQQAATL